MTNWNPNKYNLITILGPTAGGKTSVATNLAYRIGGEVISGDSRQVYRGMDLGTGKDLHDYLVNGKQIPFHVIDIVDAGYQMNVYEYQSHFLEAFNDIQKRGSFPILCGGSGLYIEAAIKGFKLIAVPENHDLRLELSVKTQEELETKLKSYKKLHNKTDTVNRKRLIRAIEIEEFYARMGEDNYQYPTIRNLVFGVVFQRYQQRKRITERLKQRLADGMIDEVRQLIDRGVKPSELIYYGLEYKWITRFVLGEITFDDMFRGLNTAIHQFAKRQMTWFRKMERSGIEINWIDGNLSLEHKMELILQTLQKD